jgi:TRAP-type uncharacterized transport system fused permease subunit
LTPPVAVAAYAASAIANANPLEIAVNAVKISVGAFVVPFAFLFNNALLLDGKPAEIVFSFVFACFGLACLAIAVEAYITKPLKTSTALILAGSGLLMLVPAWQIVVCAAGVAGLIILYEIFGFRPKAAR